MHIKILYVMFLALNLWAIVLTAHLLRTPTVNPSTAGVCVAILSNPNNGSAAQTLITDVSQAHLEGGVLSCQDGQFVPVTPSGPDMAP